MTHHPEYSAGVSRSAKKGDEFKTLRRINQQKTAASRMCARANRVG